MRLYPLSLLAKSFIYTTRICAIHRRLMDGRSVSAVEHPFKHLVKAQHVVLPAHITERRHRDVV